MNGPPLPPGAIVVTARELRDGDRIVGVITTLDQHVHLYKDIGEPELVVVRAVPEAPAWLQVLSITVKVGAREGEALYLADGRVVVMRGGPRVIGEYPKVCTRCGQPAYVGLFEVVHAHPYHNIVCPARKAIT